MGVRIKEIHLKNLGPIDRFSAELGSFNLFYGRNEMGKTYLVEFLIHSLFKNMRPWRLREKLGSGKVGVEGLDRKKIDFSPGSRLKLEDFWEKESSGLPPDFSRLLVVKGAEVELADGNANGHKTVFKRFLTGQELLDTISNKIPRTLQKAEIKNTEVIGSKQGDIKLREELGEKLKTIEKLFDQIDRGYSGGHRKLLSDEKEKLDAEYRRLEKAKRHLAFQLDQQTQNLEKERIRISEDKLQTTRETLRLYKQKIEEYKQKKKEQKEAEEKSSHHEWLNSAVDVYQTILQQEARKPKPLYLIVCGLMIAAAGVAAFMGYPVVTIIALAGLVLCAALYFRSLHEVAQKATENVELSRLENEFKTRFDMELTGLPLLQELLNKTAEDYSRARLLKDQLFGDLRTIESMKLKLSDQIVDLTGAQQNPESWEKTLVDLSGHCRELADEIQQKKIRSAELGVDPSDYEEMGSGISFSKEAYDVIRKQIDAIDEQIDEENHKLSTLKQLICQQTGDSISAGWETVIQNLREERDEVADAYKQKTAEIIGKVVVHRVLEALRMNEDIKIIEGLRSDNVLNPLRRITKRYTDFKLDGERLLVCDDYHDFPLSDLSTGAQEQVLLALRIGFSTRLLKQDTLFLILDDAFQYSDWQRRDWLMDMIIELAQSGWQIIYFTMDDHIRDLFQKRGKTFGDGYRFFELTEGGQK